MKKIWFYDSIKEEALKYKTRKEFLNNSPGAVCAAKKLGVWEDVCSHMKTIRKRWSLFELKEEALKYKTRKEFQIKSKAYHVAHKRNLLDKICGHMPKDCKIGNDPHNKKWTSEKLQEEALKYKTRSEFKKGSEGAYDSAKDLKILDKVCAHMKISINSSVPEKEIYDIIIETYEDVTKLRKRNINIPNKPYIKGFDIDIFIPSLNKGIEFDGTYYHSFEFMKSNKSKVDWPDQDIKNYHEIKDQYFLSLGIKIFHITELEWKNDKRQSLLRILDFLRN